MQRQIKSQQRIARIRHDIALIRKHHSLHELAQGMGVLEDEAYNVVRRLNRLGILLTFNGKHRRKRYFLPQNFRDQLKEKWGVAYD